MDADDALPIPAKHGSAADPVGDEVISAGVDLPWDRYLGAGAGERVQDGSLGLVRHAYPATAARDVRAAAAADGRLQGDDATRERLAAIALGIAAAHQRPARLPHPPNREPYAWWVAAERTLIWMPWTDVEEAYGLRLLDAGEAEAITVIAPDACWTVYRSGLPQRSEAGGWCELSHRLRRALERRIPAAARPTVRWRRRGDTVQVHWMAAGRVESAQIEVNRPALRHR